MSLNKIWNGIRKNTIEKLLTINQLLCLTYTVRTVLRTNRYQVYNRKVHVEKLFISQAGIFVVLPLSYIKFFTILLNDS